MSRSYPTRPRKREPFVVTSYVPGPTGELVAEMPPCCPFSKGARCPGCQLSVDHYRKRKTGPCHRLAVVRCRTHGRRFTLYPPSYAPYLRQPVLRLAPDGQPVGSELADTMLEAAVDAKAGRAWARMTEDDPPERWWGTQGRHLRFAARLFGITRDVADAVREAVATTLSVGTLLLRDLSRARGYRAIGAAVCEVFGRLHGGPRRAWHLLVCGQLVGHWGTPWRWDARLGVLERSPFPAAGTSRGSSP